MGPARARKQDLVKPVVDIIDPSRVVDSEPFPSLIERYTPPAMRAVWSDQHKFELWLRIEVLACEGWARVGRIPESALPKIRKGTFDATKIAELESRVGHDVIAFLTVLNDSIGQPEAR